MAAEGVDASKPRKKKTKPKQQAEENIPLDDGPPASSKLRIDQILQQVVTQSSKDAIDAKKKKKKKGKNQEDDVLESLRKGEGIESLQKETNDAILANTYDPDDSKSEKSNKQRQRRKDRNKNKSTDEDKRNLTEEHPEIKTTPRKKKKPKDKQEFIEDEVERELGLLPEENETPRKKKIKSPKKEVANETADVKEEEELKPKKKPRKKQMAETQEDLEEEETKDEEDIKTKQKKKKKKDKEEEKAEEEEVEEEEAAKKSEEEVPKPKPRKKKKKDEEIEEKEEETKQEDEQKGEEETEESAKGKKKEKKKKKKRTGAEAEEAAEEEQVPDVEDQGAVMAVLIHRTDKLKNDFRILHPVVRVHVVNEETGQYLPKQHQDRAVTSYYETSNEKVKFILPMMTQPFDFKERKSTLPIWEDLLMFNENFNYFVQAKPKVLILFELLDFVSMNAAREQFSKQKEEGGWHRIAWAFLKVVGKNDKVNVGHKVRLQLYNPGNPGRKQQGQPEVFQWWQTNQRVPYPSTLYVTLKSIEPPNEIMGATRSMFATQKELGHLTYKELKSKTWSGYDKGRQTGRTVTTWTRLLGQLCRVPNALNLTLTAGKKGCYVVKFSNDGRSLACGCQNGTDYPILVYEIPSGTLKGQFQGHFGIVYSLCWSKSDTQLMSASSDGTVRIWNLHQLGENQTKLLPHPGFVYTAEFHPRIDSIVVTGGYDEVIRVWDISIPEEHGMLQQEMEEHHGHINSVCFDPDDGQKMYSADSTGVIFIWNVFVTEQTSRRHFLRDWTKYQEIRDPELKDTPINLIRMHHSGRRLLVHARNNAIFMFDLRVQRAMQKYFGAENLKEKIHSTITPCGSFVFSGSEDGKVYAWNADTGDQVAVFTQLNYNAPVTDVHYHPRDHMLAICSLGNNHPIYLYKYDPMIAQADVSSPRPMSPVETTDVEDLDTAAHTAAMKDIDPLSSRSMVMSKEEFDTQEKARYHRVMRKLDTATLQMSQMPGMVVPDQYLSPRLDTIGRTGVQSTWQMPFDTSYALTPRSAGFPPSVLSPHAPSGSGELLTHQLTAQRGYLRSSGGDWRPGFSEVGRHGQRSQSPTFYGRPPHLSLNTSLGKPQFSFEAPAGKTVKFKEVVALYDYRAQRSDELTLYKGDVVKVLYKDNENWWMGETQDGQQGFFPANYVTDDESDMLQLGRRGSRASSVSSSGTVTAVKTKSGELKFVSTGEESDVDQKRSPKKKSALKNGTTSLDDSSQGKPPINKERRSSIDKLLDEYESVA